jgi:hypothetical protein
MTFQIIIKGHSENMKRLKGKNVSEFGKNLESEGWPSEFATEEQRDKVKFLENKLGRPLIREDVGQASSRRHKR